MRLSAAVALLILALALPGLAADLRCPDNSGESAGTPRDSFYCQTPHYDMIYNVSSGFDAEIADDIPVELAGESIAELTLWVGEWFYGGGPQWRDPLGLRVNFYHESCPPEMEPFLSIETAWDDLDKTLVVSSGGKRIYEARVQISPPLVISEGMSLGATMLIDWGDGEPFAGICATPMHVSYGACVLYFDGDSWGYQRWTPIDYYTSIPQDLGYCLSAPVTAVETPDPPRRDLSAHPNPFNPKTTIRFTTAAPGAARLTVHDPSGRLIVRLLDEALPAGDHQLDWRAQDEQGRRLPSGVYLLQLQTEAGGESLRLVLLQ